MTKLSTLLSTAIVVGSLTITSAAELLNASSAQGDATSLPEHQLQYETDVRPIMKAMCFQCHGEETELHGGLDVRLVRLMTTGGESGTSLVPGDSANSLLWQRIESDEMPEGAKKLSRREKEIIRRWIDDGCKTLRPEPDSVADARYTPEELGFWSFQPVSKPIVPMPAGYEIETPVDGFIAAKLVEVGLPFSPEADRPTLLRRLSFDLLGLPPTPEEVAAFVADTSVNAYEKVVDRMLASPDYGLRWGRHWLDVAGYAESDGNEGQDKPRPHAWRYRDYVIASLNADKGYDQFLREQIAGDELIGSDLNSDDPRHVELLTATALLRMAPDVTETNDTIIDRNQAVAECIKVVSSATIGLTIGCAQCHDHRYDPISAEDYYRYRAIFDPALPLQAWKKPQERLIDMTPSADRKTSETIEADAFTREKDLNDRRLVVAESVFEKLVGELPDEQRETVRVAVLKAQAERSEDDQTLLKQFPMIRSKEEIRDQLLLYAKEDYDKFEIERKQIEAIRVTKPAARIIMGLAEPKNSSAEPKNELPKSAVFFRGDPEQPRQLVTPSEVFVVARTRSEVAIAEDDEKAETTGRRLAYANQLTDGTHPLTARVAVNRLWLHHFGRGLVNTPSDFGIVGERPSHPELLDWLASRLVELNWQFKPLHRLLVLSRTYRQVSTRTPAHDAVDPENRLMARANLRRLDAETLRDTMLVVTGHLNHQAGGPSVPVAEDEEGKSVIGRLKLNEGLFAGIDDVGPQKYRRSIFVEVPRSRPLNMLATFDLPIMTPNCDLRRCSTVAPQSLWFLNDSHVVELSDHLSDHMFGGALPDTKSRINDLFMRLFGREPLSSELTNIEHYLEEQANLFRADPAVEWQKTVTQWPHAPDVRAIATLCQAMLSSNEFLYVE